MGFNPINFSCVCLFSVLMIHLSVAHLCLITPRQRGDMDISEGGSRTCFRHGAPCGGVPPQIPPQIRLEAGRPVFIKWQQNFNHYSVGYPGYMDIAIATANEVANLDLQTGAPDPFRVLAVVADKYEYDQAHQRNYTAVVTLPNMGCDHCVIRARYVAHKPGETTFYQCADVTIAASLKRRPLRQTSPEYPNLFMPGPVMLPQPLRTVQEKKETVPSLISILSPREAKDIDRHQNAPLDSFKSGSEYRQIKTDTSAIGEENLKKAIDFTNSNQFNIVGKGSGVSDLDITRVSSGFSKVLTSIDVDHSHSRISASVQPEDIDDNIRAQTGNDVEAQFFNEQTLAPSTDEQRNENDKKEQSFPILGQTMLNGADADISFSPAKSHENIAIKSEGYSKVPNVGLDVFPELEDVNVHREPIEHDVVLNGGAEIIESTNIPVMNTDYTSKERHEPDQVVTSEKESIKNALDPEAYPTSGSFLAQNDLHASTGSSIKVYGMSNNIDYPENADLMAFDTVTGIRYDVAPLAFRVDSPVFESNGLRQRLLNSSLDFVTDGVLTLDAARGVAVMPMNRHNNMDATADTFVEMDTTSGTVKDVYNILSENNRTMPLRSAFSAAIVEIESTYITFNIEPNEEDDGKYNFVVGRLYAGGKWAMLSITNQPEDLYINFLWADYDISVKTLYVLLGNENDPLGLSARLYKFFVMPGLSPVQPSSDPASFVALDVSKYPFMAFHLHPYHSNLLYAVSPGLHNATNPSYHLVVVDVDMGTVQEEMRITPPGIFERFYGGAIINGLSSFPPQLLHVLRVANTEADVIMTIDLIKKVASFSQVTNLRNVYSLYAAF